MRLNLGCGKQPVEGWVNLDACDLPGVDVVHDLESDEPLPFELDSVEEFLAVHVFEHFRDPLRVLGKLYEVAAPGATLTVKVPHGASDVAWENPTHVRPWFPSSFAPFEQPYWWREDYGYRADWQPTLVQVLVDRARYQGVDVEVIRREVFQKRNTALEIVGVLNAVKPARLPLRELHAAPGLQIVLAEQPE